MAYKRIIGVYILTHLPSGHFYVGSSSNFTQRINEHMRLLRAGKHHVAKFQELYDNDPDMEVSLFILKKSIEDARAIEKQMLEESKDDPLLVNKTLSTDLLFQAGDKNHMFGRVVDDEEKARLSIQNRQYRHTDEAKKRITESRLGKPLSEEHKAKLASRAMQVSIKGIVYPSAIKAAEALGISRYTVTAYAGSEKPQHADWFWLKYI